MGRAPVLVMMHDHTLPADAPPHVTRDWIQSRPLLSVGMIEVKPGRQEFGAALAKAGSSPWAEAAAERRQEGAPGFYMGH